MIAKSVLSRLKYLTPEVPTRKSSITESHDLSLNESKLKVITSVNNIINSIHKLEESIKSELISINSVKSKLELSNCLHKLESYESSINDLNSKLSKLKFLLRNNI